MAGRRSPPEPQGDWFSKIFGFAETSYGEARRWLRTTPESPKPGQPVRLEGPGGRSYAAGAFSTPSLAELRKQGRAAALPGRITVSNELGDVAAKHALPENRFATFQVASQFNCLEFVGPSVTPEMGITGYAMDRTQGPACSIACGAATAFRNYFAQVPGSSQRGQTKARQLDNLHDLSKLLGNVPNGKLYDARGGYTLAHDAQLAALAGRLQALEAKGRLDTARAALRIGVHSDVQVTATDWGRRLVADREQLVSQVFGSACSVAYSRSSTEAWEPFAQLILEASYEATLWAALLNAHRHGGAGGSRKVFLTCLGGGAFGNPMRWILSAMRRAISLFEDCGLDVRIVTYAGAIEPGLLALERDFDGRPRQVATPAPSRRAVAAAAAAAAAAPASGARKRPAAEAVATETPEKAVAPAAKRRAVAKAKGAAAAKGQAGSPAAAADVMAEAKTLGLEGVLRRLLARPDVQDAGVAAAAALAALQASGGLLHPAKAALLGR